MNLYHVFADDDLTFDFVTITDYSEKSRAARLTDILGRGGYLLQEKILLPASLSAQASRFSACAIDPDRCNLPLVLLGHPDLPPQYSAFIVRPKNSRVRITKGNDSIKVEADGLNILFSAPLFSQNHKTFSSFCLPFDQLSRLLRDQGMSESAIARTWLYLDNILGDYEILNQAREAFFATWHSTGIEGRVPQGNPLAPQACAFSGERLSIRQQASPLQDEATRYGKLFSRCVVVALPRLSLVYISGTAAIDRTGASVHAGNFDSQLSFTLDVLRAILRETGGDFSQVAQATVYLKYAKDFEACLKKLQEVGFPRERALFHLDTPVCRDDLLCEIELTAAIEKG